MEEHRKEDERILCIPNVKGLSETLQQIWHPLNIKLVHNSMNTFQSILTKLKTGVIYQIPCQCGEIYIGETCKTLPQRMPEHKRAVQRVDMNNSLATHVQSTMHDISWDKATTIEGEQLRLSRKIMKAIHIQSTVCLNMDQGFTLDPI